MGKMKFLVIVRCVQCGRYVFKLWTRHTGHLCRQCRQKVYTCPYTGATFYTEDGGKVVVGLDWALGGV